MVIGEREREREYILISQSGDYIVITWILLNYEPVTYYGRLNTQSLTKGVQTRFTVMTTLCMHMIVLAIPWCLFLIFETRCMQLYCLLVLVATQKCVSCYFSNRTHLFSSVNKRGLYVYVCVSVCVTKLILKLPVGRYQWRL